jgi:hypothetical protein
MNDENIRELFTDAQADIDRQKDYGAFLKKRMNKTDFELQKSVNHLKAVFFQWFWIWCCLRISIFFTESLVFNIMQKNFHTKALSLNGMESLLIIFNSALNLSLYGVLLALLIEILITRVPEAPLNNLEEVRS